MKSVEFDEIQPGDLICWKAIFNRAGECSSKISFFEFILDVKYCEEGLTRYGYLSLNADNQQLNGDMSTYSKGSCSLITVDFKMFRLQAL